MKKYMETLKSAYRLIADNWKAWLLFVAFYNVVSVTLFSCISYVLYEASLKVAGITYLAQNTLLTYILNPFTWLYAIISILLCMFLIMLEISALYRMYDASRLKAKISLYSMLQQGIGVARRSLNIKNWKLFLYLLLMLPVLGVSMAANMQTITIPGAVITAIEKMKIVYVLVCALILLLILYTCRLQFSAVAFTLDGGTFNEAIAKSKRMIKGRFVHTVVPVFITCILVTVVFCALGALIGAILSNFTRTTINDALYVGGLFGAAWICVLGPSVMLAQISSLYYEMAAEKGESLPKTDEVMPNKESQRTGKIVTAVVFAICLAVAIVSNGQDTSLNMVKLVVPEVAAHRGDSGNAPENTMPAFKLAVEDGCSDWIELDVHQTKDGAIVITHDDTLMRIDGSDRCVHEMTYDELLQVDFGSRFSEKYAGTKVATLDEVLDYCKDKIKLQIEIKPTEFDDHIEEAVVEIIRNHDMADSCVVLSMNDDTLRRIKEIDPEITTMYCMQISTGEITDIDFAEYISIEEQNVTPELINSMHAQNRKCFVWTINSEDSVQHLVDCGVDVILTDYPVEISNALKDADYSGGIARTLRLFLNG